MLCTGCISVFFKVSEVKGSCSLHGQNKAISIGILIARFIIHAWFKLQFAEKQNKKKSSKLSLRKTAFLVFSVRYHVHHFNLRIGNRFEDVLSAISSYRFLYIISQEYALKFPKQFNFAFDFCFRASVNQFYHIKIQVCKKKVQNKKWPFAAVPEMSSPNKFTLNYEIYLFQVCF